MSEYEIAIRLLDEEHAFAYTIRRHGRLIEVGRVEEVAPGYYGGSEAMD